MASDSTDGSKVGDADAWHALLHDLRGCLGGMKATLDLRETGSGLDAKDAARIETGLREALALVELARVMAFGPWPAGGCEPADEWRKALEPDLLTLAAAFRTSASVTLPASRPWPGRLLRSFTLSLARLVLPQVRPESLTIEGEGTGDAWTLRFSPTLALPLALQPGGACKDLHGLWVRAVAERHGITARHEGETLIVTIPFQPKGLPPLE